MPHVTRLRAAGAVVAAGSLTLGVLTTVTATAAQAAGRPTISGTTLAWATPAHRVGSVTSGTVNARVYLAGQNPAGLTAFATAVSTPGNALYGHYLSAAQVNQRYGASSAQVSAVESWLRSAGLKVTGLSTEIGGYVAVTGTVAQASQAFGVSFANYKGPQGHTYRANTQAASAPASVAADVLNIDGLSTFQSMDKPQLPPPGPNYWVAGPCSQYYAQKVATSEPPAYGKSATWNLCGYTQAQIRDAYGVTASGMTGKGQTVAVVDAYASPTMLKDANEFATVTGDQPFRPGQYAQHEDTPFTDAGANECDAPGWYGEESLDVEAEHGQAPDANVRFVAAASCLDSDLAEADAYIVNNHVASIVSNSWGEPADDATIKDVFDVIFQAGAAEGIGFFFSSGDSGYEDPAVEDPGSDQIQVDYPTSSPWVTSVGGTSLAIGPTGKYEFETSWGTYLDELASSGTAWSTTPPGTEYDGSSGGGVSTGYQQPFYQAGVVPTSLSESLPNGTTSSTPMRVVPDVSALADPSTGMLVGQTTLQPNGKTYQFSLSRIGGTSVASPTFAGIEADAQQAAGHPLGFADPVIYQRFGTAAFHDVTDQPLGARYIGMVRNNYTDPYTKQGPLITFLRTLGIDGQGAFALPAVKGYDDSTGVGSPQLYVQSFGS